MTILTATFEIDVRDIAPLGVDVIAGEIFCPASPSEETIPVVACIPGGGMSRRYFDLPVDGYSMAREMAAAGVVVIALDPPGVGESGRPEDGYTLTPHVTTDVLAGAWDAIVDRLRAGTIAQLPKLEPTIQIGLGHSAGALLVAVQQARHSCFDAIALLGFHGRGLPDVLSEGEREYIDEPAELRRALPMLVEARFGTSLPTLTTTSSDLLLHGNVPDSVVEALRDVGAPLLGLVGLTSLVPGSVRDELNAVDVPVFIGVGEYDIAQPSHRIPSELPSSRDVTLFVLPDAGHNHNVSSNRGVLWSRLTNWIASTQVAKAAALRALLSRASSDHTSERET